MTAEMMKKLDEELTDLYARHQIDRSASVPVVIRVSSEGVGEVAALISARGGRVRHQLARVGAVAAWLPLGALEAVAAMPSVKSMEMEQTFTIA